MILCWEVFPLKWGIYMKKEKMPVVSVIVPVYNVERWLSECMDHLLRQTLQEVEFICVNDGSTDASMQILQKYAFRDLRVKIVNQENAGLSAARNTGVRVATGKYISFVDSDDILISIALKCCLEKMENQNLEFLTFNASAFGEDLETAIEAGARNKGYFKRDLDEERVYSGKDLFVMLKRTGGYITTAWSCMLLRSAFIANNLWFHDGILHEDEPWTFKTLMMLSRCGCLNKSFYRYRVRKGSISFTRNTFDHAYGIFSGYLDARNVLMEHPELLEDPEFTEIVIDHISQMQKNAIRSFRACDEVEKKKITTMVPRERLQYEQLIVFPASLMDENIQQKQNSEDLHQWCDSLQSGFEILGKQVEDLQAKNKRLNDSVTELRASTSYRLGNKIIAVPRKAKLMLEKNGSMRYVQRILRREKSNSVLIKPETEERNRMEILSSLVEGNRIEFQYRVTGEWRSCFQEDSRFEIIYPFDLTDIPESVRIIPFLAQILPVSWICDAVVQVPSCDLDFFECIDSVKAGFIGMYPMLSFRGELAVSKLERNDGQFSQREKNLICYSGGVDALYTVLMHINETPILASIWGADVRIQDEDGWKPVESQIRETATKLELDQMTIRSGFRALLIEDTLSKRVFASGDGWHGFQHGVGILGHMALVAYYYGIKKVYIASSFTAEDVYTCASDPTIDNYVRFCGTMVVHDGYDVDRQEKIGKIVRFSQEYGTTFSVHVCWEKQGGENCCHCEKCWRTMLAFYAEGADPAKFGFPHFDDLRYFSNDLENSDNFLHVRLLENYLPIQKRLRMRERNTLSEEVMWFRDGDLMKLKEGYLRLKEKKLLPPIWILGTPEHSNMGDHCIVEEERRFLQHLFPDTHIVEATEEELLWRNFDQLKEIPASMPVFLPGGGNLGTLWPSPENVREEIIKRLPNNPVIIMPQSIWFEESEQGNAALERAKTIYKGEHILLCCRDRISWNFAQKHFQCRSILVPDMVMWETKKAKKQLERFGALTLLRKDDERKITDEEESVIKFALADRFRSVEVYDTILTDVKVTMCNRGEQIERFIHMISTVECVVTDRLHGMILCAISGTPCVVLKNGYHKVEACYEWLNDLGYIRLINNVEELNAAIESVCDAPSRLYPEKGMQGKFRILEDYIKQYSDFFLL